MEKRPRSICGLFPPNDKRLIAHAGKRIKNMTDFILEAACREAEHVLCDRRCFVLEDETFNAFEAALNAPLKDIL